MHDFYSREPDPVEAMLHPPPSADNEALRRSVYAQTRLMLRRRRRFRQLAYAASLLVSFTVGAGTMRMMIPGERGRVSAPSAPDTPSAQSSIIQASRDRGVSGALGALTRPRSPDAALEREYLAFDSEDRRSELYRQAGDRYMKDESDLQSALRCYSNALDTGSEHDLAISTDDNWLLMVIKDARQKENNHAKQGG